MFALALLLACPDAIPRPDWMDACSCAPDELCVDDGVTPYCDFALPSDCSEWEGCGTATDDCKASVCGEAVGADDACYPDDGLTYYFMDCG